MVFSVIGGITVFAVTEWLGPATVHLFQRIFGEEQHGLSIDVEAPVAAGLSGWVFAGKAYGELMPPPTKVERENLNSWAKENGGTAVSQSLSFVLRGRSDKTVDVKQFEPEVICRDSVAGVHVYDVYHVSVIPGSSTTLEADANPPEIVFTDDNGNPVKSPKYQVAEDDKEEISLSVIATSHRCMWSVIVHWSMDGQRHETRVPEKGRYVVTGTNAATQHRTTDGEVIPDY
ncbi:hypothetical protein PGH47_20645 [Streptomyces sp. HUAS 31]|uniref:hypothetical protein n=1 Tax=Streptomyces sp. HUAS 31 TaxID=3020055 RepID=UPI0023060DF6|nr:hypothetical protein [Streptomyces sp. HUAS 31]WCD97945.1 hypothetical protein PGH47_20645 [Streptomyces sp. HUAS 31]